MNDGMLSVENDFSWSRDEPVWMGRLAALLDDGLRRENELRWRPGLATDRTERFEDGGHDGRQGHTCFHNGVLKVIYQVLRIFDTDTKSDEILWKSTRRADSRVYRGVSTNVISTGVFRKQMLTTSHRAY